MDFTGATLGFSCIKNEHPYYSGSDAHLSRWRAPWGLRSRQRDMRALGILEMCCLSHKSLAVSTTWLKKDCLGCGMGGRGQITVKTPSL